MACQVFISYTHKDEWLKDELISHFAALKRNGLIEIWHDRLIPAGGQIHDEIDARLHGSDIFLLLISTDFIASEYCFRKEYAAALERQSKGEATIVPIIVRSCDWDVDKLKTFNALPPDATPVTQNALARNEPHLRDDAWTKVIAGLKPLLVAQNERITPPHLVSSYTDHLFDVDFIRHPAMPNFDERRILVDPDVYREDTKEQITTTSRIVELCKTEKAIIFNGCDRSGKTLISKVLQAELTKDGHPTIRINGQQLRNADITAVIERARHDQFGATKYPASRFKIIVDDFDECSLPDRIKEALVKTLNSNYAGCIFTSFSNAPAVLFSSSSLPTPLGLRLNPISDNKLYALVQKWVSIGHDERTVDATILSTFEKVQIVFTQTELEKYPSTAVTFLELLDSVSGSDITTSSYAACYDSLITIKLSKAGVNVSSFDEVKNFLSLLAYDAYVDNGSAKVSEATLKKCLAIFEKEFLSSASDLHKIATSEFLRTTGNGYYFCEEYLWYFLCARYVVKSLKAQDPVKYNEFVTLCTANIFQKKFANIVIFIAYFSNDTFVLESLLQTLDRLFSKATEWVVSDDTRELMMGLNNRDTLEIENKSDPNQNRLALLQERLGDVLEDAEKTVAQYTLPFLSSKIADSDQVETIDQEAFDASSYMKSVNALLRTHSVIGQILTGRSGTFSASLIMDCITRMVQASGRYVSLNHAIAAILIFDKEKSLPMVDRAIEGDKLTLEEKYEKVTKIFAFWSVYISHAGLARYLSQDHSVRALEKLVASYETDEKKTSSGHVPFNFSFVLIVARLYQTGKISKSDIENCIKRYGEHSSLIAFLRVVFHIYAYYMDLNIEDKQWISQKLRIPLKRIELQRLKASEKPKILVFQKK